MSNSELAASYAALILADDGVDITVRNPLRSNEAALTAAGRQNQHPRQSRRRPRCRTHMGNSLREGQRSPCFQSTETHRAQALEGKDVKDLLLNVGSGGGAAAPAAGGAGGAAAGGAAAAEEPDAEEEKKEEGMSSLVHPLALANQTSREGRVR
jgi:large subunit ribosomal protein LP1